MWTDITADSLKLANVGTLQREGAANMTDTASKNAGFGGAGPENMLALAHGIAKAQADLKPTKLQSMICEAIRREFPDIDESCVKRLIQIFVEQMSRRMREF